ncbi:MAG: carbohydrate ABC transporter permease [Spirochaetaceae bacterium]|nr:carbohydrate ABC transporter permease [Spirochaetaceae bacterium]
MLKRINLLKPSLFHLLSIILSFFFVAPILWALMASFRPETAIFQGLSPLSLKALLPDPFTWENFKGVFDNRIFKLALINTLFIAAISIILGVAINAAAGFAFSTMQFRGKKVIFSIVLSTFLIHADLLAIPTYNLIDSVGLIDTKIALILPILGNGMVIFMFIQFFGQIPNALREAAIIDGATNLQVLLRIYLPLTLPTIIGASLILFLGQWEAFLWPLVVARSPKNGMIQIALSTFTQQYGTLWGMKLAAASLLCFIPLAILMPLQKYYINSIVGSAIKG